MKVDRTIVTVVDLHNTDDDRYWRMRTPIERLRAVQLDRQAAYGHKHTSKRLQRVLEIAERERR